MEFKDSQAAQKRLERVIGDVDCADDLKQETVKRAYELLLSDEIKVNPQTTGWAEMLAEYYLGDLALYPSTPKVDIKYGLGALGMTSAIISKVSKLEKKFGFKCE